MPTKGCKVVVAKDNITKDIYNYYAKNYENPVDFKTFKTFLGFNRKNEDEGLVPELVNLLLFKAFTIELPVRVGWLKIIKYKKRLKWNGDKLDTLASKVTVNWEATKKLWNDKPELKEKKVLVFHDNRHSNGYSYAIRWDKYNIKAKNIVIYKLRPTRKLSRKLAEIIKSGDKNIDYYEN